MSKLTLSKEKSDTVLAPPPAALDAFLLECQQRIERRLELCLKHQSATGKLAEAIRYGSLDGGKRLRPVLCYAGALAVDGKLDDADAPAMAVELMHCYSLIHDDLPAMDNDDLRRGKPSLHKAFNEATAILAGDALQALAFSVLAGADVDGLAATDSQQGRPSAPIEARAPMLQILARAAEDMVAGQALDFAVAGTQTEEEELTAIHRLKTGALIRASVLLGALSRPQACGQPATSARPATHTQAQAQAQAQASHKTDATTLENLSRYADCIGLAFQIQDDILDETGDTATLGKPRGSDRKANKPTYVTLLGLEAARARARALASDAIAALDGYGKQADQLRHLAAYIVTRGH
ncbi:MAG: polyprenyl synthetase family protein [Pseudohongiellaceae bacterium]